MTERTKVEAKHKEFIRAPREQVYDAFATSEGLNAWWTEGGAVAREVLGGARPERPPGALGGGHLAARVGGEDEAREQSDDASHGHDARELVHGPPAADAPDDHTQVDREVGRRQQERERAQGDDAVGRWAEARHEEVADRARGDRDEREGQLHLE